MLVRVEITTIDGASVHGSCSEHLVERVDMVWTTELDSSDTPTGVKQSNTVFNDACAGSVSPEVISLSLSMATYTLQHSCYQR